MSGKAEKRKRRANPPPPRPRPIPEDHRCCEACPVKTVRYEDAKDSTP